MSERNTTEYPQSTEIRYPVNPEVSNKTALFDAILSFAMISALGVPTGAETVSTSTLAVNPNTLGDTTSEILMTMHAGDELKIQR
jgi:hypothetical protein